MSESEADYQREMEIPEEYAALRNGSLPPDPEGDRDLESDESERPHG